MMNRGNWAVVAATVMLVGATGCGRKCKEAQKQIIQPAEAALAYLVTNPSGQDLAGGGCSQILTELAGLPEGAARLRHLADTRYSHVDNHCVRYETATRFECHSADVGYRPVPGGPRPVPRGPGYGPHPHPGPGYNPYPHPHPVPPPYYPPARPVCYPHTYTYCVQWSNDVYHDPAYGLALETARDMDIAFNKASGMCNLANTGDLAGAEAAARDLTTFMQTTLKPEGQRMMATACHR